MMPDGADARSLADLLAAEGFEQTSRIGSTAWHGKFQDRECTISVGQQSRTRYAGEVRYRQRLGFRLRIELSTFLRTRLFFVKESVTSTAVIRWIYRWRKQTVVEETPPELHGFRAVAVDAPWAERLLAEHDAMGDVAHLLRDCAPAKLAGSVYFQPGVLHYGSPILQAADVTAERAFDVLRRLNRVAQAAERIDPPPFTSELSRFERFAKGRPMATALLFFGGCLAVLLAVALLAVAVGLLVSR